jgi:hypothetical protein
MQRGSRRLLVGQPERKRLLRRPRLGWGIKCILKKEKRGHELNSSGSEQEQIAEACGNGNEHSCAIKCRD